MKTYEIETERLILRNYKESDFNDFWDYVSQPNVGPRTGGWPPYTDKAKAKERLLNVDCKNPLQFALYYKEDKKVIGSVEIMEPKQERYPDVEIGNNTKEIGYLLSEDYWSRGIMTEAVKAIVCFAFSVLKVDKIVIGHDVKNIGSGKVQEKVGFRFVKQSSEVHAWLGEESHLIEREMTREDYLKIKELQELKNTLKVRETSITENIDRNVELFLRKPTFEDEKAVMEYKAEFLADGSPLNGASGLKKYDIYADWLEHLRQNEAGETAGRVPASEYLAVRKSDGRIVGMLSLRHYYDEKSLYFGGHIGDSVRPSERRKGYATQMIGLALDIYKEMGVDKVLISCTTDNIGSAKSIEKNGGVLENEVWYEADQVTLKRYWIDVRKR